MTLPFRQTIGVLGGGQLGKMLIEASRPLNFHNLVLENDPDCPARTVADEVVTGKLTDPDAIRALAQRCDVLTFEIEHVGVETLIELEMEGKRIVPSPGVLQIIRDKGTQKQFYADRNLPTTPFVFVNAPEEWVGAIAGLRGERLVAKSRTGGYDGRGVDIFERSALMNGSYLPAFETPVVIEEFVPDAVELAVIVAADGKGDYCTWPAIQMEFHPVANLVEFLFMPSRVGEDVEARARRIAEQVVQSFDSAGVFAVELLIDRAGDIWINETAPRPHNSGHHTIEACYTSQYEQLNRILAGLPLGDTSLIGPAAMINLLGPEGLSGRYALVGATQALSIPGVYIHLYNKALIKPFRKMGHVTVIGPDAETVQRRAREVRSCLRFVADPDA